MSPRAYVKFDEFNEPIHQPAPAAAANLHDMARSFTTLGAKVAAATELAPIIVSVCWQCDRHGYTENGDRCYVCGGKGSLATEGGEP